jgi:hypothetical protein
MNVLLVMADPIARSRLAGVLATRNHNVVAPTRMDPSQCSIQLGDIEVALVDFVAGSQSVDAWMRALRMEESRRHVYVIALVDLMNPRAIDAAWAWGADDMTRATALTSELLGRVDALQRIRSWMGGTEDASTVQFRVEQLQAWHDIEALTSVAVGGMLGANLVPGPGRNPERFQLGAELRLCLPREHTEVGLVTWLSPAAATQFGTQLFGAEVADELLGDALREAANTAAGAFRRAASEEGTTFATVLPTCMEAPAAAWSTARHWTGRHGAFELGFVAYQRKLRRTRAFSGDLREGMVLATDLRNPAGMTLAAAGTVITERTAQRIIDLVGTMTLIEIIGAPDAAAAR